MYIHDAIKIKASRYGLPYHAQKYPNQKILYVRILEEVYAIPFAVKANGDFFLRTLFPSGKASKFYQQSRGQDV